MHSYSLAYLIPSWLVWSGQNLSVLYDTLPKRPINPLCKANNIQEQRAYCINIYVLCMYHRHFLTCHSFTKKNDVFPVVLTFFCRYIICILAFLSLHNSNIVDSIFEPYSREKSVVNGCKNLLIKPKANINRK